MTDATHLLIGTDEAGYGPNLGPLVVSATAWELPAGVAASDLWREFDRVICNSRRSADKRLFVADSKAVYSPGNGLEDLEVPVLAFLRTLGHIAASADELGLVLAGEPFLASYRGELWNTIPGQALPGRVLRQTSAGLPMR